ncbi:MAG TPA: hypothetical protein VGR37_24110 [Longimicrobiaceae bacterium]|nr:hypothetical protein [Longimicrobiaceae bacterium]
MALWRALRKVGDWAATSPKEREALFQFERKREAYERLGAACAAAPELVEAFGTFAELIRAPAGMEAARLAAACSQVHAWAEERSLIQLGMVFAEGAALADPECPAKANDAGRMCRRAAEDQRASSWYHRGHGLGVRRQDDTEIIRALIGYGNLMKDLGKHDEARKFLEGATRRAANTGRRRQAGEAQHDLLTVAAEVGTLESGMRHVRKALDLYPLRHPALPALIHDWAFLLVRLRFYTRAIPLLEMVLPRICLPEFRTVVWSTLARAVAGAGIQQRFGEIEQVLKPLIQEHAEYAPAALVNLAEGSRCFGRWDEADGYARSAIELAHVRNDRGVGRVASELSGQVAARALPFGESEPANPDRLNALSLRLTSRLRLWKAPGER